MSGPMLTANDPNWWLGILAGTIGHYLKGGFDEKELRKQYAAYRASPCVDDELRALLPEPTKGRRA